MSDATEFKQGDVVRVKGQNGPKMTVDHSSTDDGVKCVWWSQQRDTFVGGNFFSGALEKVPDQVVTATPGDEPLLVVLTKMVESWLRPNTTTGEFVAEANPATALVLLGEAVMANRIYNGKITFPVFGDDVMATVVREPQVPEGELRAYPSGELRVSRTT